MICLSCNKILNNEEIHLVFEDGEHIDLCLYCLETTDILAFQCNLINELEEENE